MHLLIITLCVVLTLCAAAPQRTANIDGDGPTDIDDDDWMADDPWYWGSYPTGCRCNHGWGWGAGMRGGWGWGYGGGRRGRGYGWGPGGMRGRGWGPGWWQTTGRRPTSAQDGSNPDANRPFMPWFLEDLTPEEREKFWEEMGDTLPPPMTYERRARILEVLKKITS